MDNTIWNEVHSTLDINGPILSLSEQPTGVTGIGTTAGATGGGSVSFTGIATGVDPGTGYLSYQWYEQNVGKLSDSTYVTGTASTGPVGTAATLTISNLITPTDNQRKFYLEVDYVPSAYGVGRSTGNAWNEPLTSGIATATVTPLIEVVSQPTEGVQALINVNATISVNSDLTDGYFADDLQYQWYLNGEAVSDGVKTVTTTTGVTTSGLVEHNYSSQEGGHTLTIPATAEDIEVTIAGGRGGNGGLDGGGPGGGGGNARAGKFTLPNGEKELGIYVGKRGNDGTSGNAGAFGAGGDNGGPENIGDGGHGGGAGQSGWSGGGGGGGAASYLALPTGTFLVAAGGGGGGGGSWNRAGDPGDVGKVFPAGHVSEFRNKGGRGETKSGDGGGGGGGGGGTGSPQGGQDGQDLAYGGEGGEGGASAYEPSSATLVGNSWSHNDGGYVNIKYTGYTDTTVTTVTNTTLSGTTSNILTIQSDSVGVQTCQCKITSATASNSPIWTDVTNFVTTSTVDKNDINIENIGIGLTATLSSIDLGNGDYEFSTTQSQVSSGNISKYYSFYASEKDIDVEMDLYGGKGDDKGSYTGGEGGYSRIRFTMEKNTEYVIVGLSSDLNAPFLYRKGELVACVGAGGDAGISGNGGNGGGVTQDGDNGRGRFNGDGGHNQAIISDGRFGSHYTASVLYPGDTQAEGRTGGRTITCTKGIYWAQQGLGACADIAGTTVFRLPDGTPVTNTSLISRGFKAGYNIIETAGAKEANGGRGGNGAIGGMGGGEGGGGGGSGYNDGSITVVDTQSGGSTEDAKVILRVVT